MRNLIPVVVVLSFLVACQTGAPADANVGDQTTEEAPLQLALVAPVEISVPVDIDATGQVVGAHQARVAAGTTGRLVSVDVERGHPVRKGDTLARVDDRLLRASLEQAEAALSQAESSLKTATDEAKRARSLFEQGLSNTAALDRAEAAAIGAEAAVASGRAVVRSATVRVEDSRIKAPFDGIVITRMVSPGEYVRDDSAVVELVGTDGLRVELTLGERQAAAIVGGETVLFRVMGDTADRVAVIDRVAPAFRAGSRDLVVEALVDAKSAEGVRPGAFVSARVTTGERPVLSVPASAVRTEGVVSRVYVAVDGQLEERIVPIGPEIDGQIVVLDGLLSNERVVVEAVDGVRDGARIAG